MEVAGYRLAVPEAVDMVGGLCSRVGAADSTGGHDHYH